MEDILQKIVEDTNHIEEEPAELVEETQPAQA